MRPLTTLGELVAELPGSLMLRQLGTHWRTEHPGYAVGAAVAMFHRWSGEERPLRGELCGKRNRRRRLDATEVLRS